MILRCLSVDYIIRIKIKFIWYKLDKYILKKKLKFYVPCFLEVNTTVKLRVSWHHKVVSIVILEPGDYDAPEC